MPDVMTDRRSSPRYALILSAEVSDKAKLAKLAGRTSDISRTGCYIDTLNPIPAGTTVVVRLQPPCGDPTADSLLGQAEAVGGFVRGHDLGHAGQGTTLPTGNASARRGRSGQCQVSDVGTER